MAEHKHDLIINATVRFHNNDNSEWSWYLDFSGDFSDELRALIAQEGHCHNKVTACNISLKYNRKKGGGTFAVGAFREKDSATIISESENESDGVAFREWRVSRGLSLREVAAMLGTTPVQLGEFERGVRQERVEGNDPWEITDDDVRASASLRWDWNIATILRDRLRARVEDHFLTALEPLLVIAQLIETQDNRATAHPLFAVQQRYRIWRVEEGESDGHIWMSLDGDYVEADDEKIAELDALADDYEETPGWERVDYRDVWQFVTACLTEQGCEDYIAVNGHNLTDPRIYTYSAHRNEEVKKLRAALRHLRDILPHG